MAVGFCRSSASWGSALQLQDPETVRDWLESNPGRTFHSTLWMVYAAGPAEVEGETKFGLEG